MLLVVGCSSNMLFGCGGLVSSLTSIYSGNHSGSYCTGNGDAICTDSSS